MAEETTNLPVINEEQQKRILERFKARIAYLSIKPDTKTYYKEQAAYFSGVATAVDLFDMAIPPAWILYCMSDRSIIQL